jgi:hypothetical protein
VRFRQVVSALAVALATGSCSLGDPLDAGVINLFVGVDKPSLGQDESMIITVTARNVGFDPIQLTGPANCLLAVDVLDNEGSIVWNSNFSCPGPRINEDLVVGTDKIQTFEWNGTGHTGARLASGFYHLRAVARLGTQTYFSPPLSIALD